MTQESPAEVGPGKGEKGALLASMADSRVLASDLSMAPKWHSGGQDRQLCWHAGAMPGQGGENRAGQRLVTGGQESRVPMDRFPVHCPGRRTKEDFGLFPKGHRRPAESWRRGLEVRGACLRVSHSGLWGRPIQGPPHCSLTLPRTSLPQGLCKCLADSLTSTPACPP